VQHLNTSRKALHNEVIYLETTRDDVGIELAMQYNDGYNDTSSRSSTTSTRTKAARTSPASRAR
jgi:DNA gyrase/topoisomerase IV subunit B